MFRDVCSDGLAPEDRGFEHVGLVHGAEHLFTRPGCGHGDRRDTLDFTLTVDHSVNGLDIPIGQGGGALGLSKVDASGQFPNADDINAVGNAFGLEW